MWRLSIPRSWRKRELNHFYEIYPEKFSNKTNGITFRRWLLSCNKELTALIGEGIGNGFKKNADELEKLLEYIDDNNFLDRLEAIKVDNKKKLAAFIQEKEGVEIIPIPYLIFRPRGSMSTNASR